MNGNIKAFLDMIAVSEGTAGQGDRGYNVIVGHSPKHPNLFTSYKDHPRKLVSIPQWGIKSTAAGRYQLLARYYDAYRKLLGLKDFSPESQDAIAIQQIKECRAIPDIEAGRFDSAVARCAHIWASLPGAGYGQHTNAIEKLRAAYIAAGGTVA